MNSRYFAIAAVATVLVACGPVPAHVAAIPGAPAGASHADQYRWVSAQQGNPPADCATAPTAPAGTPTPGEEQGSIALAAGSAEQMPSDWPSAFDIPAHEVANFSGAVEPRVLKPGAVIFRVIGKGGNPLGAYWADAVPPVREKDWRAAYAVFSDWNGASCLERYVVPQGARLEVWEGRAGPQNDKDRAGYYLEGGAWQIWIPNAQSQIPGARIQYAQLTWQQ